MIETIEAENVAVGDVVYLLDTGSWDRVATVTAEPYAFIPRAARIWITLAGHGDKRFWLDSRDDVATSDMLCSMCGRVDHTERMVDVDGEWSEDCEYIVTSR